MPYGLPPAMDQQIAAIREASEVSVTHIDTCLSSFLTDHHNRPGEALFGVYVDGTTSRHAVMTGLIDELRATADRVPAHITDDDLKACIKSLFCEAYGTTEEALAKPFDASLEVPSEEEAETMGGDEMCQAWFLLVWTPQDGEDSAS